MKRSKNRRLFSIIYFCGLLLAPIVLVILPANFFDHGPSICLSVVLLDKTCIGCGMTRAFQHIMHLDFKAGYEFNKLCVIVFPIFFIVYLRELFKMYNKLFKLSE